MPFACLRDESNKVTEIGLSQIAWPFYEPNKTSSTANQGRDIPVHDMARQQVSDHEIHETCHSVTFYFMNKLLAVIRRKCFLLILAGSAFYQSYLVKCTSCRYQKISLFMKSNVTE